MNRVVLIGRLTKDPELQTTANNVSVCKFTLAVNRTFKGSDGENKADFLNIVVWRNQAEVCAKYLRKGSQCAVVGSIQTSTYEGNDGTRRYSTDIVADQIEFLQRAGEGGQTVSESPRDSRSQLDDLEQITDDDVPF